MKDLHLFEQFGKTNKSSRKELTNNCVIYTRVSSKDQRDNFSLPLQLKTCTEYTERYKFNVLGTFGGDYESAKSDERKEFKRMFDFIKKSKLKVSYIIVYKLDRFSRTGPNAIYLKDQLQNQGIYILSVTEPSDPTTISGTFQQDIQLVVSKFDNAQRRERTINGMRERLRAGYWSGPAPTGYDIYHKGKEQIIVVNEQGKLLRKAFEWKGNEGLSNTEIMHRLRKLGLNFDRKKMTDMFRNPFYCGIITHKLLDGQVVEGKHEKLITKELFLRVNNVQLNVSQGWKVEFENNDIPLKRYLKCSACGKNMRGYLAKKKKIHYYKCGTPGCRCNVNAKKVHTKFIELLKSYRVEEKLIPVIRFQLEKTFEEINHGLYETIRMMKSNLTELQKKMERLEERYIDEELSKELYEKHMSKFTKEEKDLREELEKHESKTSNLDGCIDQCLTTASQLDTLWQESSYYEKHRLQNLVFPEGVFYNKENDECRTGRVNLIFEIMSCISRQLENKKAGKSKDDFDFSGLVARRGLLVAHRG